MDQPATKPQSSPSCPLLTDPQASAVSDSNTRQRQNTQLHKDTRSRLQETDTLKTVRRQAKERVRERDRETESERQKEREIERERLFLP